ncbi:MAG: CynX/NimT family MFS transporter [Candidatus Dormibacteria bacterium]
MKDGAGPAVPVAARSNLGRRQLGLLLVAFWVGFNLRAALLGVPPVLNLVRTEYHLNYAVAGLITALPILAFGVMAFPGAAMVRRLGGYWVVGIGLVVAVVGELGRTLPGVVTLFVGTAVMGTGIAITQPGLPAIWQHWFRGHVQLASVTMTLGITVGEVVGAGITQPLLLPLLHSWQGTMVFWGILGASCVPIWFLAVPRERAGVAVESSWELGRLLLNRRLWSVYVLFGGQSLVFFSSNTWIPTAVGGGVHSNLASLSLVTLNGVMVPVDVLLILISRPFATRRWFYLASAGITLLGTGGWLLLGPRAPFLFSTLIGVGVAMNFAGLLAYPPLVAAPTRVASLTAAMLTVGYAGAFFGPFLGGVALDLGGGRQSPFIPITVAAAVMLLAAWVAPITADFAPPGHARETRT